MAKPIIWAECNISIGKCGDNGELAKTFASIGDPEDNTTQLNSDQGDVKELKKTGGVVVDRIENEGVVYLETTLLDPTTLYSTLGIGTVTESTGKVRVKSLVAADHYSMRLTPKREGGYGIEAPCTQISVLPQGEEAKGSAVKLRFTFLEGQETTVGDGNTTTVETYLYDKFVYKKASA